MKTKLYVFDNGGTYEDSGVDFILAPRSMTDDVVSEIYNARSGKGSIVLVAGKYDWKAVQRTLTLAEFFGQVSPANATAYEKLSKPAKRYLNRAWNDAAEAAAALAAASNGAPAAAASPGAGVVPAGSAAVVTAALKTSMPNPNDKEAMAAWSAANQDKITEIEKGEAGEFIEDF